MKMGLMRLGVFVALAAAPAAAGAATIIDEWTTAVAPPAPALKPVTVDAKTTGFLVLDLVRQGCNDQRRPRCLPTIPAVQRFLERSRAAGAPVIYSLVAGSAVGDIVPALAARAGEPSVQSGTDKFLNTDLDAILRDRGIKTVVVVGTAAHGAVLTTATEAALRGYQVVVAVDGISSETVYAEQFSVWNLMNAPVIAPLVTVSRTDLIEYKK